MSYCFYYSFFFIHNFIAINIRNPEMLNLNTKAKHATTTHNYEFLPLIFPNLEYFECHTPSP